MVGIAGDVKALKLNTGAYMPMIGLGTWKAPKGIVGDSVYEALKAGYRHIDCAEVYENEDEIGESLKRAFDEGIVKREELFITSKLNNPYHAEDQVLPALKRSLKSLQLEYLDLYLMHWPVAFPLLDKSKGECGPSGLPEKDGMPYCDPTIPVHVTWKAMEKLMDTNLVKAIGVANFTGALLFDLLTYAKVKPAVNQVEMHPLLSQSRLVEFCQSQGIVCTAYTPLGGDLATSGGVDLIKNETIGKVAKRIKKTPAQVMLRWQMERGVIAIPKSCNPGRIRENISIFDFKLSPEDMKEVDNLNCGHRFLDPWNWYRGPLFV